MFPIEVSGVKTNPAISARRLGVIFDKDFTFRSHVSAVCSSCFYHVQDLLSIRRHLDLDSAKLLATAPVSSCLNYCNSLLCGICNVLGHMLLYLQISTMLGCSGRKRQMAVVLALCKTAPFNL